jgi:hypothetical protein
MNSDTVVPGEPSRKQTITAGRARRRPNWILAPIAIAIAAFIVAATFLVSTPPANGDLDHGAQYSLAPLHEGDSIVWSINVDQDGHNLSGTSTWTFSNVNTTAAVTDLWGLPKYDVTIRTVLNGNVTDFNTAGAYRNGTLWALGISPAVISMGTSGYYNGEQTYERRENILTSLGEIGSSVYAEQYYQGSSQVWIADGDLGIPLKMEYSGIASVYGSDRISQVTVTFNILSTSIGP